jgi:hypothetical protein
LAGISKQSSLNKIYYLSDIGSKIWIQIETNPLWPLTMILTSFHIIIQALDSYGLAKNYDFRLKQMLEQLLLVQMLLDQSLLEQMLLEQLMLEQMLLELMLLWQMLLEQMVLEQMLLVQILLEQMLLEQMLLEQML